MNNLETFIIAGGKGTRFKKISIKPKLLAKLKNTNLLKLILKNLKKNNLNEISIFVGKHSNNFKAYRRNKIKLIEEKKPLGTSGCLSLISKKKLKKDILIIFGDILFDIDISKFYKFHISNKSQISIFSHPSDHLFDSDIIDVDTDNRVKNIFFKPHKKKIISNNLTMAGIFIVKSNLIKKIPKNKKNDFSKNFLKNCLKKKVRIYSYKSREYCKDLGTSKRYLKVLNDFKEGTHKKLRFKNKLKAVFLDRDGVINVDKGPQKYSDPTNFLKGTLDALQKLQKMQYLKILITNQPAVAKGFITIKGLQKSFKKLESKLANNNIFFDGIYYCPHHPKSGFKGENKKYKINCSCRKPKPGLILKAARDFNIDLKKSFFIGDRFVDYKAARSANVKPIILNKLDNKIVDYKFKTDLREAINLIK